MFDRAVATSIAVLDYDAMSEHKVALVAETKRISAQELASAEAVLQKQLTRDFAPIWGIKARLQAYSDWKNVPTGSWPVTVRDAIDAPGTLGFHSVNKGLPYAQITYGDSWQFAASHDMLEMLADPNCNRTVAAPSVRPGERRNVNYLVEICDPSGTNPNFGYDIDGVRVANFCTPQYYDAAAKAGVRHSFTKAIGKPLEILKGGYLSWSDPQTKRWCQKIWWNEKPEYRDLGVFEEPAPSSDRAAGRSAPRRKSSVEGMILRIQQPPELRQESIRHTIDDLLRLYGAE